MKLSIAIYCLLLCVFTNSCGRYIDNARKDKQVKIMQGSFTFYPDSNVLIYKSNIGLRSDNEIRFPKPFYAKLPKGIKWYEISNSTFVSFYYDKEQVISINTSPSIDKLILDTSYIPEKSELDKLIIDFLPSNNAKFDIHKIELKPGRKQVILRKDSATILFYNILPRNYSLFLDYLNCFRFL